MKKQYLIAFLTLAIAFPISAVVLAETGTSSASSSRAFQLEARRAEMEARRAEMDAEREARRAEFEAKRAEMEAKRVAFQQRNAERKVEQVTRVMLATIERLQKIGDRIQSRIDKIDEKGGDTADSEQFLAAARVNLDDAKVAVEAFGDIDLSGDDAQENYEKIRAAAAGARELIREAHTNLMMAVRSLSAVEVETEDADSDSDSEGEED